ncbi:MAG: GNAT family N-acetyltransferase [Flavobacteriales bacterium]
MIKLPVPSLNKLTTERLVFRTPTMEDRSWWMEFINSKKALQFLGLKVGDPASCTFFIQKSLDRIPRDGTCLNAVIEHATGKPIGMVGLLTQEVEGVLELEIGYHMLPSAWGMGYAKEAAVACKVFAAENKLASSVISLIDPTNFASQAVAKHNGMVFERKVIFRNEELFLFRTKI